MTPIDISAVAPLFDGTLTPGIYQMTAPRAEVLAGLREAGWQAAELPHVKTPQEALTLIGEALSFPKWYGRNLDALWDCLGDLTQPTALYWRSWQELAIHFPDEWAQLMGVLKDRTEVLEHPFALIVE
ncbi:MAG: barstar family protein [Propionibacteriaceae bacterium]